MTLDPLLGLGIQIIVPNFLGSAKGYYLLPPYLYGGTRIVHEGPFLGGFRKMIDIKKMVRSCIYHCICIFNYLKSSLNVQIFVSADQILAFFAQIE